MTNDRHLEVSIQNIGLGVVLIGEEPVAPAGGATLDIPGATLDFDPALPSRLPSCLIADAGAATPVVEQIYGPAVRDGVLEALVRPEHGTGPAPRDALRRRVHQQPPLESLSQLAAVRFCQVVSALPLDPGLLQLEELALLGELEGIVEADPEWAEALHQLLGAVIARPNLVTEAYRRPAVRRLLIGALDVLAGTLPLPDERRMIALEWLESLDRRHGPEHRYRAPEWTSYLGPEFALAAGGGTFSGQSTADWADVPLGILSRREGNVSWRVEVGESEAVVYVTAKPADATYRLLGEPSWPRVGLAFDLVSPGWIAPLASGSLENRIAGDDWMGGARLGANATRLLRRLVDESGELGVRVRTTVPQPRLDPVVAEARRWTSRAVFALRLGHIVADERLLPTVSQSLERACGLWELAGHEPELTATRNLQRRAAESSERWGETLTVAESILITG